MGDACLVDGYFVGGWGLVDVGKVVIENGE